MNNEEPPVIIKRKHIKQPHRHTFLEAVAHLVSGIVVAMVVVYLWFPNVTLFTNLSVTLTISGVKFVVNYWIRRYFAALGRKNS